MLLSINAFNPSSAKVQSESDFMPASPPLITFQFHPLVVSAASVSITKRWVKKDRSTQA